MDLTTKHKKIARELVEEIGQMALPSRRNFDTQIIVDDEKGHYLLFSIGWHGQSSIYGPFVHIDVLPGGKVWLQHDGTDLVLARELVKRGIPSEKIVLGFKSPIERQWIEGYATA